MRGKDIRVIVTKNFIKQENYEKIISSLVHDIFSFPLIPGKKHLGSKIIYLKQAEMTHIDTRLSLFSGEKSTSFLTIDKFSDVPWKEF